MKKWYVREEQTVTRYWEYDVEAETEAEAIALIKSGDAECFNHDYDEFAFENNPIEVTEIEEIY